MDRLWDAVLQLIFDSRGTEEIQVLLDEFGRLVDFLLAIARHGRLRLVEDLVPLVELPVRDFAHGKAEGPETF